MTKIRTAEEVLTDWIISPEGGWEPSDHEAVIGAMQEYAKQFIELAAEQTDYCVLRELPNGADAVERNQIEEKILKIKDLIK